MLQFLQYKVFGRHRVPDGWIVVTAGNPPEYNNSVHEFDIVTWDRLKRIDVEPDFGAWREYRRARRGCTPSVHLVPGHRARPLLHAWRPPWTASRFVTARGWDDLSATMIQLYERARRPGVDEAADRPVSCRTAEIAEALLRSTTTCSTKYRADYQIERILEGSAEQSVVERAREAAFDERVSLMGLITDALGGRLRDAVTEERAVEFAHGSAGGDAGCHPERSERSERQSKDPLRR